MTEVKRLDPASLKALAHPLRVELFEALSEGPATATGLAERFGESSGATSYHLRQLARFGFIEEERDRGDGRQRWWRTAVRGAHLDVRESGILDDPPARELARWYVRDAVHRAARAADAFLDAAEDYDRDWVEASDVSHARLELTAAQLAALRDELGEVFERHRVEVGANPDPDARQVHVVLQAFPAAPAQEPVEPEEPADER